jgi:CopG family nickel-responsive transcriptional regulator
VSRPADLQGNDGANRGVSRISISLPEYLLEQFDAVLAERGFENRSQAIAGMIRDQLSEHHRQTSDEIMTGTITLFYDHGIPGLQRSLAELQHDYIDEVISSLHVHLMHAHTMEVILVQGPAARLQEVADKMLAMRGVLTGQLHLAAVLMPPVHPLPDGSHR